MWCTKKLVELVLTKICSQDYFFCPKVKFLKRTGLQEDISELISLLVLLLRDGESIPTLVSTPINLNVHE